MSDDAPVPDSIPATGRGEIVVLNRDLFFGVRLGNALRGAGYGVTITPTTEQFAARMRSAPAPVLGIVDLAAGVEWDLVRQLTTDAAVPTPVLVFGPHRDAAGFRAAKEAGVRRVVANSELHRDLLGLVARYARSPNAPREGKARDGGD